MRKSHTEVALIFLATVFVSVLATQNGELSHLATGLINCQPVDLSGSTSTFAVSLSRAGFDAATPAHALGTTFLTQPLQVFRPPLDNPFTLSLCQDVNSRTQTA